MFLLQQLFSEEKFSWQVTVVQGKHEWLEKLYEEKERFEARLNPFQNWLYATDYKEKKIRKLRQHLKLLEKHLKNTVIKIEGKYFLSQSFSAWIIPLKDFGY